MPMSAPHPSVGQNLRPAAAVASAAREEQHEQQAEDRDGHRDRDPQEDQEPEDDTAEQVPEVQLLHLTAHGARGDVRSLAGFDVAVHLRAVARDDAAGERDDVAADAPGDVGVAVHDEDVAGDLSANDEMAVTHVHVVVDRAVDRRRSVDGHDRTVDHLAVRNHHPAADADAPVVAQRTVPRRASWRGEHREDDGDERECAKQFAVHYSTSTRTRPRFSMRACGLRMLLFRWLRTRSAGK